MGGERRYDLDWIRVLVFGLLILYHVGMFFVPWEWHIKNNEVADGLIHPMRFVNQWRLPVLFLISGMGTWFALSKRSWRAYLVERHNRLVIPLVFGMVVIVAPQVYVERLVQGAGHASFMEFYPHYFEGVYPEGNFSWHHLWFLPYLFVFSAILTPVFVRIRDNPANRLVAALTTLLDGRGGILLLGVPLLLAELLLRPHFPVTHNLVRDWYTFVFYITLFCYGFLFISAGEPVWRALDRQKRPALLTGTAAFSLMTWIVAIPERGPMVETLLAPLRIVNLGAWAIVVFGYGRDLLNRPSRALAYCNQAVYPFYIAHQTIIVVAAYQIHDLAWPVALKFLFLTASAFGGSWIVFEVVKRFALTRLLFGVKPLAGRRWTNPRRQPDPSDSGTPGGTP